MGLHEMLCCERVPSDQVYEKKSKAANLRNAYLLPAKHLVLLLYNVCFEVEPIETWSNGANTMGNLVISEASATIGAT